MSQFVMTITTKFDKRQLLFLVLQIQFFENCHQKNKGSNGQKSIVNNTETMDFKRPFLLLQKPIEDDEGEKVKERSTQSNREGDEESAIVWGNGECCQ